MDGIDDNIPIATHHAAGLSVEDLRYDARSC